MESKCSISFYLDTRRKKENGLFPVRLRVYSPTLSQTKFYPTNFEFTEKEFQSIWETNKPRNEHKAIRLKMAALENKANEAVEKLPFFTFRQFRERLYRGANVTANLFYYYDEAITRYKANYQFGTASNYDLSKKSIINFLASNGGKESGKFSFSDIDLEWLTKYEYYMLETKQRSRTTVSMYLRALRTIFNNAIAKGEIEKEIYPFGVKKYEIPSVKNVKKALKKSEIKILYEAEAMTIEQEKAKDFWFFSYNCNGMNVKDISLLKYENLEGKKLEFYRAKTINTSKKNLSSVIVHLNEFALLVIERYGNQNKNPKNFIFPILTNEMTKMEQHNKVKNFTRFINQNLKLLAIANGISESISTYWARHSFATQVIQGGGSFELAGEMLNHSNPKTTAGYFAGFEDETKKDIVNNLMKF